MHPGEEQLNDYIDGALAAAEQQRIARHLEECSDCALFVAVLQHIVSDSRSLPVIAPPERVWEGIKANLVPSGAVQDLEAVTQRLEDRNGSQSKAQRTRWRGWTPAWGFAMAAALAMAFLAGRAMEQRHERDAASQSAAAAVPAKGASPSASVENARNVRERVLLVAVGDHLERSQMVLVELANAQATQGDLDISAEQQSADELLASNRLYRQTAVQLGQTNVAGVLDELERVLVEVARGPSQVSMKELGEIQQRIEAQGILFKVKIVGSDMRERGNSTNAASKQPVS
jgi:hypothetical protein